MTVTVEIPDAVAREMHLSATEAQRRTLASLVVDGYRKGELSRGQVSELLDLSFSETADLLKEHGCGIGSGTTFEEYEREYEQAQAILKR
jgi:predicted HTH domain antitoxin